MSFTTLSVPITGLLILGFSLTGPPPAYSQIARDGARAAAVGGAATALDGNPWARCNPALAAGSTRRIELSASQLFGLSKLQHAALALVLPAGRGTVSSTIRTFGFSQFRSTQVGLAYAAALSPRTLPDGAVGVLLIYDHTAISTYGSNAATGAVIGASLQVSSTLMLGLRAANIHRPLQRPSSSLRQQLSVGLAYGPAARVQLLVDLHKDVHYPAALRTGIEFQPADALVLRAGVRTLPRLISAGVSIHAGAAEGSLAFVRHYALGWSPTLSLGADW